MPYLPKLAQDESRVRRGFFAREQVEVLCTHLPEAIADMVLFLFFSAWRVGEVRTLEWRDYNRAAGVVRLRPEQSKNKRPRVLPVDTDELAEIIERRLAARRLDCPYVFHQQGRRIGDFRKAWQTACTAIGLSGRSGRAGERVHGEGRTGGAAAGRAGREPGESARKAECLGPSDDLSTDGILW
jgi:integrase